MASTYHPPTYAAPLPDADIRRMAGVNDAVLLIGRILLVLMFLFSGYQKFADLSGTAAMIAAEGLPVPMTLAAVAATVEVLGGLMIVFGWQTRIAALGLAVFTAVAIYYFHDFWNMPDGPELMNNMIHAMKNLSVIGAFLMLAAVGAGRYSIDGPCIRHERPPAA
jgi:putative oxidoreductase